MSDYDPKKIIPLTLAQRAILHSGDLIRDQLPILFPSGFAFESCICHCRLCGRIIPDNALVGTVELSFSKVAIIEALGGCEHCMLVTPFQMRVYGDRSFAIKNGHRWTRGTVPKPPLKMRLLGLFKTYFTSSRH